MRPEVNTRRGHESGVGVPEVRRRSVLRAKPVDRRVRLAWFCAVLLVAILTLANPASRAPPRLGEDRLIGLGQRMSAHCPAQRAECAQERRGLIGDENLGSTLPGDVLQRLDVSQSE